MNRQDVLAVKHPIQSLLTSYLVESLAKKLGLRETEVLPSGNESDTSDSLHNILFLGEEDKQKVSNLFLLDPLPPNYIIPEVL